MLTPDKVRDEAKEKEDENYRFRTYLKMHAKEEELDQRFFRLHNELFAEYDCSKCRNCCKMYKGTLEEKDIMRAKKVLGMEKEQLIDQYLNFNEIENIYETKHKPCDFLMESGECRLGEVRPDNCKDYPYTNRPERLYSLYSVLDAITVCPVAFEIYERLKKEYGFRRKR
jgi:Fe-S-cluster containining protein